MDKSADIQPLHPEVANEGKERIANVAAAAISAGRKGDKQSSFAELSVTNQIAALFQNYAPLSYMLPFQIFDYIELLSVYNPDFSQAVDNIRTLANSGHNLFVSASADRTQQRIKDRLEEKSRLIRQRDGGVDGIIDQLLDDAATYGAMCGEWIANETLDDIIDFNRVNPKHIRFFWMEDENQFVPFQKVTFAQQEEAEQRGQQILNGCVRLNENTFHYYGFDSAPGSPYGTPPFLAALPNIAIQRDMVNNLSQIVKKVGLLGIIDLSVKSLPIRAGESDSEFQSRAVGFLNDYVTVVEQMVRDGGIIHFDDVEAKTYNITGNAAGATNIFKQNEELIFSGLKSMPSVQGRSYSTTETYAGVAYDIIIRNTYKYQRAVKRMMEAGYWLMVMLWGENPDTIRLEFQSNKSLHRLQDAQAFRLEIFNAILLWAVGIIDQTAVAQTLGYQQPVVAYDTPPDSPLLGSIPTVGIGAKGADGVEGGTTDTTANDNNKILELIGELADLIQESAGQSVSAPAEQ